MPIESLVEDYNRQRKIISDAMNRQSEIIEEIRKAGSDDFDWIPVKVAAKRLNVSLSYLYTRKDLEQKYIGSKIYLRWSQCKDIDDRNNSGV